MILTALAAILATLVVCLYIYRRFWAHRYFKRLGIPGPKPHWLFGNLLDLSGEGDIHLRLAEWSRKYGKIYGYYEGPAPVLVISDVNEVQNVFVKQYGSFHGRKMYHFQEDPDDSKLPIHVLFARGDRWKRLRTIINPAFSSKKLRQMTPSMMQYQHAFMKLLEKNAAAGEPFNIFESFQLLTMDTIGECGFGIALNSIGSEGRDNPTLKKIQEMFEMTFKIPPSVIIAMILPEIMPLLYAWVWQISTFFPNSILQPTFWLYGVIDKLIARRKTIDADKRPQDLMQMMLDLEQDEPSASSNSLKVLSHEELKAQIYIFLIAGYETTSNALAFASRLLALDPEKQDRLVAEIDAKFADGTCPIDHDSVVALPYLDAVVNETLRMFPVGLMVTNRLAMEETQIGGYCIPKGLPVQADIVSIHNDPVLWGPVDPAKFHPERWLPDYPTANRPDASFLSFGFGPRLCVGNRFALLEMKLTLVNILRKFKFERCDKTENVLSLKVAHTMTPKNGIWITLKPR